MNVIDLMVNGFSKIFKGEKIAVKHILLIIITAFVSISSVYLDRASEALKTTKQMPDMNLFLTALAVLIICGIYMAGYNLIFSHNAFDKDNPQGIMPEIDIKPFKVFWNALPLMICWTFYIFTSVILSCFIIATNTFMKIFGIALLLFVLMFCAFVQFVYIEYSKNYDKKGLYNITLPFQYLKKTFSEFVLLGLLFIPVYGVAMMPSFFAGVILALAGIKDISIAMFAGGILGGYFTFLVQIVWYYCLVQIYKEKIISC